MNKRALLIAIVSSVIGAVLLFLYLRKFEQDMSGGDRVKLLVAVKPLDHGQVLTEDVLTVREVPLAYVEDRAVKAVEKPKIVGLRIGNVLQANQTLLWTDLAIAADERRDLSSLVQPGNRAFGMRAVGDEKMFALISPGDYVDVIAIVQQAKGSSQAIVLLQRILVLAVGLDTTGGSTANKAADQNSVANSARLASITLSINLQEAQLLSLALERGKITVALRNPDDQRIVEGVPDMGSDLLNSKDARPDFRPKIQATPTGPTAIKLKRENYPPSARASARSPGRRFHCPARAGFDLRLVAFMGAEEARQGRRQGRRRGWWRRHGRARGHDRNAVDGAHRGRDPVRR